MTHSAPESIERIALLNFGGIGDEILFSPVIHAVRAAYPEAYLSLILEARSGRFKELIPELDFTHEVQLHKYSRFQLFWKLLKLLRGKHFDAVISSGSSPFIAVLLWASGIPIRIGFDSGKMSRKLLTAAAPLNRKTYAGDMYFSLAETFLKRMQADNVKAGPAIPKLSVDAGSRQTALELLAPFEPEPPQYRIMIHPGVSHMSVQKNILKAWPLSSWENCIQELLAQYPKAQVYLLGGPDDKEVIADMVAFQQTLPDEQQARMINLYGKTMTLKELAALIAVGDVLISVDSAPMHLAVGLNTPVVAIFAPTDEKKLLPQHPHFQAVARDELLCRPCLWDIRQVSCDKPVCLDVKVSDVLARVQTILTGKTPEKNIPQTVSLAVQQEYEL